MLVRSKLSRGRRRHAGCGSGRARPDRAAARRVPAACGAVLGRPAGAAGRARPGPRRVLLLAQLAADEPRRLSAVAEHAGLDLSTVSRQVAALEAAGLVSRTPDPTDRRATHVEVSPAGHEVLGRNRERWQAVLRELLADWT